MTVPTVEPAGVSEELFSRIESVLKNHPRPLPVELIEDCRSAIIAARQQLADSAHEVERLNAANAAMRGAVNAASDYIGKVPHGDNCYLSNNYEGDPGAGCNCGKESMVEYLAALAPTSQPSRGKCETCAGTKVNPKWSAGDRFAAMDCPDCAQGGSPADPERPESDAEFEARDNADLAKYRDKPCIALCSREALYEFLAAYWPEELAILKRPSPPPTAGPDGPSDIVAGLREKTLAKLKEFVVMSNDQLLKCDLNRLHFTILDAIAALKGAK